MTAASNLGVLVFGTITMHIVRQFGSKLQLITMLTSVCSTVVSLSFQNLQKENSILTLHLKRWY